MKKEEIVGLAVRIFALYLAVSAVTGLGTFMALSETGLPGTMPRAAMVAVVVIPLMLALLLWFLPLTVAHKLLPVMPPDEARSKAGAAEYQAVALSVLGMWVLAEQLPTLLYWVGVAVYVHGEEANVLTAREYGKIASTVAGLGIGFWLLFGARGIVGVLRSVRNAGAVQ
jgi:hypothetical protein